MAVGWALLVAGCGTDISPSNAGGSGGTGAAGASASGGASGGVAIDAAGDSTDACGDVGQVCCANDACNESLGCTGLGSDPSQHRCFPCGHLGELCCLDLWCGEGLRCGVSLLPLHIESPDARCYAIPDSGRPCITNCEQPGGQYCGRISDNCGRLLECGQCNQPGFTCGGAGVHGLCGAAPDSGACHLTVCEVPNGQYCGQVGDGCGSSIDCGSCRGGVACGASGVPNTCGEPPDGDLPPPLPPPPPPPLPPHQP